MIGLVWEQFGVNNRNGVWRILPFSWFEFNCKQQYLHEVWRVLTMVLEICKTVFLDFVHRLYFNKISTSRKLDLLPSSGKKERRDILAVGPPGWELNQGAQQLGFLSSSPIFYLKTEAESSFRNVVV
jgi:hypothetical protein